MPQTTLAIGLMSGTSLDGVDAALIETDGEARVRPVAFRGADYSADERARLAEATAVGALFVLTAAGRARPQSSSAAGSRGSRPPPVWPSEESGSRCSSSTHSWVAGCDPGRWTTAPP